ncbi:MAG TPA: pirin family protein [Polyangiaceae bacterium]|jgi:hypothetical protein|nr:pirin family protein [Polyangiaceae bacterium]
MSDLVLERVKLGFPWVTTDPFLFCVHHLDYYPEGNPKLGPKSSLAGRNLGQDFEGKDGWRMYHGESIPGFPAHPHRGFETVTIVRQGYIDHSDSLGATARFSTGDVQWLTAGAGIVHSEMFPLLSQEGPNTLELFQIWLNLPGADKLVEPHFSMLWNKDIPRYLERDDAGRTGEVTVVAGKFTSPDANQLEAPAPPPHSWASRTDSEVAIWIVVLEAGASVTLPAASEAAVRTLYLFSGTAASLSSPATPSARGELHASEGAVVRSDVQLRVTAADDGPVQCLLLQGRPIAEPVVQYGPFVMNTREQIQRAISDYQRTRYGGWPWSDEAPVHGVDRSCFARHADGRRETP